MTQPQENSLVNTEGTEELQWFADGDGAFWLRENEASAEFRATAALNYGSWFWMVWPRDWGEPVTASGWSDTLKLAKAAALRAVRSMDGEE